MRHPARRSMLLTVLLLILLSGCKPSAQPPEIKNAWSRPTAGTLSIQAAVQAP